MIAAYVPPFFQGHRKMWLARMYVVASRRAESASATGRADWAKLWHRAAESARADYLNLGSKG